MARWRAAGPPVGSSVVVGFSGGCDSLCLAALLARTAPRFAASAHLVHLDHRLRPGSAADAERAAELARRLDLPISVMTLPTDLRATHPGVGIEEAARRERYLGLADRAAELGTRWIATGHQRDDQAETVLLHLLRGAGLAGAAGMAETSARPIPWWNDERAPEVTIWRPLLREPKVELEAYIRKLGLEPVVDESNSEIGFQRNAVRHVVLPALERVAPHAQEALARYAERAAVDGEFLDRLAERAASEAIDSGNRLRIAPARALPVAIRSRVIARWLRAALPPSAELTANRVEAVMAFLDSAREGRRIQIGGEVAVSRSGDFLIAHIREGHDNGG